MIWMKSQPTQTILACTGSTFHNHKENPKDQCRNIVNNLSPKTWPYFRSTNINRNIAWQVVHALTFEKDAESYPNQTTKSSNLIALMQQYNGVYRKCHFAFWHPLTIQGRIPQVQLTQSNKTKTWRTTILRVSSLFHHFILHSLPISKLEWTKLYNPDNVETSFLGRMDRWHAIPSFAP